jgi:hypothetical protein
MSWSADGKELLVATMTGHIAAYPITGGDTFSTGAPEILVRNVGFDARYALATRDHSRFLIRVPKDIDKDRGEIRLLSGGRVTETSDRQRGVGMRALATVRPPTRMSSAQPS